MKLKTSPTSQQVLSPSSPNASPKRFGSNARIAKTSTVSPSDKQSSQDASGPTQVLVFMLDPTKATTISLHSWTRLSKVTTDMDPMTNTFPLWITLNLIAQTSHQTKMLWSTPLVSELLVTLPVSPLVHQSIVNNVFKLKRKSQEPLPLSTAS